MIYLFSVNNCSYSCSSVGKEDSPKIQALVDQWREAAETRCVLAKDDPGKQVQLGNCSYICSQIGAILKRIYFPLSPLRESKLEGEAVQAIVVVDPESVQIIGKALISEETLFALSNELCEIEADPLEKVSTVPQFEYRIIDDFEYQRISVLAKRWAFTAEKRRSGCQETGCQEKEAVLRNSYLICRHLSEILLDRESDFSLSHEVIVVSNKDPNNRGYEPVRAIGLVKKEEDSLELRYLATNPQNICPLPGESHVKGAGRALVHSLCLECLVLGIRKISLIALTEAQGFYVQTGFHLIDDWMSMETEVRGPFKEEAPLYRK